MREAFEAGIKFCEKARRLISPGPSAGSGESDFNVLAEHFATAKC